MRRSSCGGITPYDGKILSKEEGIDEVLRRAMDLEKSIRLRHPVVLGISGGSGSGKSTFANELSERFVAATVINADDYYKSCGSYDCSLDEPGAIDLGLLEVHLGLLKEMKGVMKPRYDFKSKGGERIDCESLSPTPFIIVDGLYVLNESLAPLCDVKVFIETDLHGRFVRRLTRDPNRTGQDPADILAYFLTVVEPMYRRYIDCQKSVADVIIRNPYDRMSEPQKAGCVEDCQFKAAIEKSLPNEILRRAGAVALARTSQEDAYFSISEGHSQELIRIRKEPGDRISFTYKTPRKEGGRSKFEFLISPQGRDAVEDSFTELVRVNKLRDLYSLNGVIFSQDEVRFPGKKRQHFIEVRGLKREEDVSAFLNLLGIKDPAVSKASYFEIGTGS
ncbi:MAG: CYTH domain-containing protein [Candidatus Paceibacterota bacterium]